ncbi:MAG: zinc ribbon domain-containing protein [Gemmatimonadetes bacterium]|nr:zinc ribbon domain-containing protein [Gemmatimonadota bacterium]
MNDVQRMFQRLVEVLAASGMDSLREPIELPALYQKIIPYRTNRGVLRFDTNEDYEMTLLRLLAGEQGLVEVEPAEAAEALAREAHSVNPNPGAFRSFGTARARLSFKAVKELLEAREPYAPVVEPEIRRPMPTPVPPVSQESTVVPETCPQCSGRLPIGRAVNFCPHCGGNVRVHDCPQCGTQLDLDWRHCVTCGYRVA